MGNYVGDKCDGCQSMSRTKRTYCKLGMYLVCLAAHQVGWAMYGYGWSTFFRQLFRDSYVFLTMDLKPTVYLPSAICKISVFFGKKQIMGVSAETVKMHACMVH